MGLFFIILFCIATLLLLVYIGYIVSAFLRAKFAPRHVQPSGDCMPPVSVIVTAFNEELFVKERVDFLLEELSTIHGSEVLVFSSGSRDKTNQILSLYKNNPVVRLFISEAHRPKVQLVNQGVMESKNEIIVFSDCRQIVEQGAIVKMIHYFNDPEIGTVNVSIKDMKNGVKPSFMRRFLNEICYLENKSGSSFNLHGALYAQRKSIFRPFPSDILFDDLFAIVSTLNQGKRLIQAPDAFMYDIPFKKYYSNDRIERLARGLLIFLVTYWHEIRRLPTDMLFRFLMYKYFKLLAPLITILVLTYVVYWMVLQPFVFLQILVGVVLILSFLPGLRYQFVLFFKVNFYFLSATVKFFFLNERGTLWNKLDRKQLS
ncbi:MAG: glycosyltransferase [Sediminibacterium sp.]|nr:glycosyltransferase [Sediminibacterium sp.]